MRLKRGDFVYGVNTGFGGSADTRTVKLEDLQRACVQLLTSGVLTDEDTGRRSRDNSDIDHMTTSMPLAWVRGLMLSRVNSLLRGHSAVSMPVISAIVRLLNHDLIPVVPLRGSISASGDLGPLSYVAAVLQGNPDVFVRTKGPSSGEENISSVEALGRAGLEPIKLAAKEALGLLNGTAASISVASLVLHEANNLVLLGHALTAMSVEALRGTVESFHPFISEVRPHKGQKLAAATMLSFLEGSSLARGYQPTDIGHTNSGLHQDRYALRTAPQWIGPILEDLELAHQQIAVELNSTTDNPVVDPSTGPLGTIFHGGNFQAASVTCALEKVRSALSQMGKILFAQATEVINPATSSGLPPNLCADDPSTSFTCKGLDINMAAYAAELGWLNHPVGPTAQSAEMHNQSVNSLALVAGRMTQESVVVLSMLCSASLFTLCQALDLRVLQHQFLKDAQRRLADRTERVLVNAGVEEEVIRDIMTGAWNAFVHAWNDTATLGLKDRCEKCTEIVSGYILNWLVSLEVGNSGTVGPSFFAFVSWRRDLAVEFTTAYGSLRTELFRNCQNITPHYLGRATSAVYLYVREGLGVPFFRGLDEDPSAEPLDALEKEALGFDRERKNIGTWVGIIYQAVREGKVVNMLLRNTRPGLF